MIIDITERDEIVKHIGLTVILACECGNVFYAGWDERILCRKCGKTYSAFVQVVMQDGEDA